MFKFFLISLISLMFSFVAFGKQKKDIKYPALANTPVTVVGEFMKHDKEFSYLRVKGAKGLIKIKNSYLINSPTTYERLRLVNVTLPLGRYLLDNPTASKNESSAKKSN